MKIRLLSMILMYLCHYMCWKWLVSVVVLFLAKCVREQTQNPASLTLGSSSWFSPRRPGKGLSDMVSRSGERHSPKRGREETWEFWARHLTQARGVRVLSDRNARLGENGSPKRVCDGNWCWLFESSFRRGVW